MLSKSKTTKALLYSTAALSLFAASHVHADETSNWAARSVDQIKADIAVSANKLIQFNTVILWEVSLKQWVSM